MLKIKLSNRPIIKYKGSWGCYDYNYNTIKIKRNLKLINKIEVLTHELGHWLIGKIDKSGITDYIYDIIDVGFSKQRGYNNKIKTFKKLTSYYFKK